MRLNIHKLLLAFEALGQVKLGRLDGGHVGAAMRELKVS
jgi:hypothetical protein